MLNFSIFKNFLNCVGYMLLWLIASMTLARGRSITTLQFFIIKLILQLPHVSSVPYTDFGDSTRLASSPLSNLNQNDFCPANISTTTCIMGEESDLYQDCYQDQDPLYSSGPNLNQHTYFNALLTRYESWESFKSLQNWFGNILACSLVLFCVVLVVLGWRNIKWQMEVRSKLMNAQINLREACSQLWEKEKTLLKIQGHDRKLRRVQTSKSRKRFTISHLQSKLRAATKKAYNNKLEVRTKQYLLHKKNVAISNLHRTLQANRQRRRQNATPFPRRGRNLRTTQSSLLNKLIAAKTDIKVKTLELQKSQRKLNEIQNRYRNTQVELQGSQDRIAQVESQLQDANNALSDSRTRERLTLSNLEEKERTLREKELLLRESQNTISRLQTIQQDTPSYQEIIREKNSLMQSCQQDNSRMESLLRQRELEIQGIESRLATSNSLLQENARRAAEAQSLLREKVVAVSELENRERETNLQLQVTITQLNYTGGLLQEKEVAILEVQSREKATNSRLENTERTLNETQSLLRAKEMAFSELESRQRETDSTLERHNHELDETQSLLRAKEIAFSQLEFKKNETDEELLASNAKLQEKDTIITEKESREREVRSQLQESERMLREAQVSVTQMTDKISQLNVQIEEYKRELHQKSNTILYLESRERETYSNLVERGRSLDEAQTSLRDLEMVFSELDLRERETYAQLDEYEENETAMQALLHRRGNDLSQLRSQQSARLQEVEEKLKCGICSNEEKKCALQCGHMLCETCLQEIRNRNNRCPHCRMRMENVIPIYF